MKKHSREENVNCLFKCKNIKSVLNLNNHNVEILKKDDIILLLSVSVRFTDLIDCKVYFVEYSMLLNSKKCRLSYSVYDFVDMQSGKKEFISKVLTEKKWIDYFEKV